MEILSLVGDGKVRSQDAARLLDTSTRQLNRLMIKHGVKRPPGVRAKLKIAAEERRQARKEIAELVLDKKISKAKAAKWLQVTERTVERYLDLLREERSTLGLNAPAHVG